MRAGYDFSPLYRSLIGADHMADVVESALQRGAARDYPPYDIEKTSEDGYRITLAVAGYRPEDLEVTALPGLLVVRGRPQAKRAGTTVLHQGLAHGAFEQRFELAEHVRVAGAGHADGLLTIDLAREIPEALKPRRIEINASRVTPLQPAGERKAARQAA